MKMAFKGDLNPEQNYQPGDIVRDRGRGYRVRSHRGEWLPVAAPPDHSLRGRDGRDGRDGVDGAVGRDGADGVDGDSIRWMGPHKRGRVYHPGEAVSLAGESWIAVANTNVRPGRTKSWQLMAAKGDQGEQGERGHEGISQSVVRFRREIVQGERLSMIFATDAEIGDAVYAMADGRAGLAQANGQPQALTIGLAVAATTAGWPGEIATSGLVTNPNWLLTPGTVYYLSPTTPGGLTASFPSTIGDHVCVMGAAVSETQLNLKVHWALVIGA